LNNIMKHAEATRVSISLRLTHQEVRLSVVDDGRGFDARSIPPGRLGLGIMQERAAAIGARLRINSRHGAGSQIRLVWRDPSAAGTTSRA
jgi:two-component system nitrate/nitrite sensor histidine kinase NarX